MNPAALVTNLGDLVPGGILIVNNDAFDQARPGAGRLRKPIRSTTAASTATSCSAVDMTRLTRLAVEGARA